jgi:hypothetical protein
MPQTNDIKSVVLNQVANGQIWRTAPGPSNYSISGKIIHVRFCSSDRLRCSHYKFNINPNTLMADYEVWICSKIDSYYLMPTDLMPRIHSDPESYIDSRHPEIRVVSVSVATHTVNYGRGGKKLDLTPYYNKAL